MTDSTTAFVTDSPTPSPETGKADARAFAIAAARRLNDFQCEDILVFDVTGLSPMTRFLVIATGTSDKQIKSLGAEVGEVGREMGFDRYGSDRDGSSTWLVLDHVEVMIHLFEPATRGHYDLEMLWGDAPRVPWRRS